jgi:hypothetical protein
MALALRSNFINTSKQSLTLRKILRHGADGFTSSTKQRVLRIFVALKNLSPSVGFEPANFGSNSKHANHYTTEDNYRNWLQLDMATKWLIFVSLDSVLSLFTEI